jgi:hypothetical protein
MKAFDDENTDALTEETFIDFVGKFGRAEIKEWN